MNQKHLGNFIRFAKNNYHKKNLEVFEICTSIGCSKSYLHEILIREYQISTMEYIEYFRILKAIELILEGEDKVYLKVGYTSSASFSRAFKRVIGISQTDFKNTLHATEQLIPAVIQNPKEELKKVLDQLKTKNDGGYWI